MNRHLPQGEYLTGLAGYKINLEKCNFYFQVNKKKCWPIVGSAFCGFTELVWISANNPYVVTNQLTFQSKQTNKVFI